MEEHDKKMKQLEVLAQKLDAYMNTFSNAQCGFSFLDFAETCEFLYSLILNNNSLYAKRLTQYIFMAFYVFQAKVIMQLKKRLVTETTNLIIADRVHESLSKLQGTLYAGYVLPTNLKEAIGSTVSFGIRLRYFFSSKERKVKMINFGFDKVSSDIASTIAKVGLNGSLLRLHGALDSIVNKCLEKGADGKFKFRRNKSIEPCIVLYILMLIKNNAPGTLKVDVPYLEQKEIKRNFVSVVSFLAEYFYKSVGFDDSSERAVLFCNSTKYGRMDI